MDKETEKLIDTIAERAANNAIARMREFHQDDLKALRERMDIGFESVDRRFDQVNEKFEKIEEDIVEIKSDIIEIKSGIVEIKTEIVTIHSRLDRLEDAFSTFLKEFRADKEKLNQLEAQVAELVKRVSVLEAQLASK